jgi:hypothetical protein
LIELEADIFEGLRDAALGIAVLEGLRDAVFEGRRVVAASGAGETESRRPARTVCPACPSVDFRRVGSGGGGGESEGRRPDKPNGPDTDIEAAASVGDESEPAPAVSMALASPTSDALDTASESESSPVSGSDATADPT